MFSTYIERTRCKRDRPVQVLVRRQPLLESLHRRVDETVMTPGQLLFVVHLDRLAQKVYGVDAPAPFAVLAATFEPVVGRQARSDVFFVSDRRFRFDASVSR